MWIPFCSGAEKRNYFSPVGLFGLGGFLGKLRKIIIFNIQISNKMVDHRHLRVALLNLSSMSTFASLFTKPQLHVDICESLY